MCVYVDVSKNRGGPPKWIVKIMENPIRMDDLGVPLFLETSMCFRWRLKASQVDDAVFHVLPPSESFERADALITQKKEK